MNLQHNGKNDIHLASSVIVISILLDGTFSRSITVIVNLGGVVRGFQVTGF